MSKNVAKERESKEKYIAYESENRDKKKKKKRRRHLARKNIKRERRKIARKGEGRKILREIQESGKTQWPLMIYHSKNNAKLKTM